jgi:hypothetical protein
VEVRGGGGEGEEVEGSSDLLPEPLLVDHFRKITTYSVYHLPTYTPLSL